MLARVAWTLATIAFAMAVAKYGPGQFDWGSGVERCGVAGLTTSCGSVAP